MKCCHRVVTALVFGLVATACNGEPSAPACGMQRVEIMGGRYRILAKNDSTAVFADASRNGNCPSPIDVSWTSNNTAVARVWRREPFEACIYDPYFGGTHCRTDPMAVVTGESEGTATIRAMSGGKTDSIVVTVVP